MNAKGLTEKQKRFVDYYIELGNATEAAKKAGYKQPHVQGAQNLEKLREIIQGKVRAKDEERIANQDEVLRFLTSVMRNEQTEQVVVVESLGAGAGSEARIMDKEAAIRDRTKAAELLGKRYCIFSEKPNTGAESNEIDLLTKALMELAGEIDGDE